MEDDDSDDMLRHLLQAIVSHRVHEACKREGAERSSLLGGVFALAVKWNAPEVAPPVIEALVGGGVASAAGRTEAFMLCMQLALELHRSEFVEMLLEVEGLDAMDLNLFRLYTLPEDVKVITQHLHLTALISTALISHLDLSP